MALDESIAGVIDPARSSLRKRTVGSRLRRLARDYPLGAAGAAILVIMVAAALLAPWIATQDPIALTPTKFVRPGAEHFMGTDRMGRDVFARVVYGAQISLLVGLASVAISTFSGAFLGILSGYLGGKIDLTIQRIMDSVMAFPTLVLLLAIVAAFGASVLNMIVALGLVMTPAACRVVRGTVLSEKENQYVEAARSIGCTGARILWAHILPNVIAPIIVIASVGIASAILSEAALSYLGVGTPPPTPSWGGDLGGAIGGSSGTGAFSLRQAPWVLLFPGAAISLAVLGLNLVGDAIRDALDPKLRGR